MKHARILTYGETNNPATFTEWDGRSFRDASGILHPANIASLWTEAERKAVGLYPIIDSAIPEGKVSTGSTLVYDAGTDTVTRTHTLADAPPPPVPQAVTMFQARAQLSRVGILASVEAAIADAGGEAALAWEYALELRRDSPTVIALAAALEITEATMDGLFRAAALIEA
jgi:hypothetical protein